MLYLFYGENDYLIKQAVNNLVKDFSEIKRLDFSDATREIAELRALSDVLSQQSLFAPKRLFILQGFLKKASKQELETLLKYLKAEYSRKTDVNLVFYEEKLDKRKKIVQWLLEKAKVQEFKSLKKLEAKRWIVETIKRLSNQAIEQEGIEELIHLHGSNLWALENEIKKLTSYAQDRKITLEDIKHLCVSSVEENIFAFTDAISLRNKKEAAQLFSNLISKQTDPWYLFAMLIRQFRLLILMRSEGKLPKAHPFVIQKTRQQVKFWELPELKRIYQQLLDIDIACKTGKGDLPTDLSLLIAGL